MRNTLIVILLLFICSCNNPTTTPGTPGNPDTLKNANDILSALGVSELSNPPTLKTQSRNGAIIEITNPESWQPLKSEYSVFAPKYELIQLGLTDDSYTQSYFEDRDASYTARHPIPTGNPWVSDMAKVGTAADLNGDGIDEFVILFAKNDPDEVPAEGRIVSMMVYHNGSYSAVYDIPGIPASTKADDVNMVGDYYYRSWQLDSVDINGDGKEEVLFVNNQRALILSINESGTSAAIIDNKLFSNPITCFTAGDFDGDNIDEFLVACEDDGFALYNSSFDAPVLVPEFTNPDTSKQLTSASFGDFTGNGIDELAVIQAANSNLCTAYTYSFESTVNGMQLNTESQKTNFIISSNNYDNIPLKPESVDIDGDGSDELVCSSRLFNSIHRDWDSSVAVPLSTAANSTIPPSSMDSFLPYQVGDVDCDGKEDIITVTSTGITGTTQYRIILQSFGIGDYENWNDISDKKTYISNIKSIGMSLTNTLIGSGNYDDDSCRVRFIEHNLEFTQPVVIATLASPPYYEDIASEKGDAYNYGTWETTFGKTTETSASNSTKVGFSVSTGLEFEQGVDIFGINIANFKTSTSFTSSTNWQWTTGYSLEKSITYAASGGENRIIFTSIPMDIYSYEVIQSPESSDIGNTMYIKLPRDFSTYSVQDDFYNNNNGILPDIPSQVLQHSLGDPSSYFSENEKNDTLSSYGGYQIAAQPAGQGSNGSGITSLAITVTNSNEQTIEKDFSNEIMTGAGAGGVTLSTTLGFNSGFAYSSSSAEGTSFGGTVGFLPTEYYSDSSYAYSSGLFAYKYDDPDSGQSWWAVDYWVE